MAASGKCGEGKKQSRNSNFKRFRMGWSFALCSQLDTATQSIGYITGKAFEWVGITFSAVELSMLFQIGDICFQILCKNVFNILLTPICYGNVVYSSIL